MRRRRWSGNTLGPANHARLLSAEAKAKWEQHYLSQPTKPRKRYSAKPVPPEQQAIMKWIGEEHQQYDLALTLHWANSYWMDNPRYRPTKVEPADAYRNDVRHFFNIVDRKLFGSAHRQYGKRFGRLVGLHCSPGVGWHVHAAISTPDGLSQSEFIHILEREWCKHLGHHAERSSIATRLFDAQHNNGDFAGYTIRHENGKELDINKQDVGVTDWGNTALQRRNVN